jgi:coenzyme PQQ precursor peptide PqqA
MRRLLKVASGRSAAARNRRKELMTWATPQIVEICVGMEINDYFPAVL